MGFGWSCCITCMVVVDYTDSEVGHPCSPVCILHLSSSIWVLEYSSSPGSKTPAPSITAAFVASPEAFPHSVEALGLVTRQVIINIHSICTSFSCFLS